MTISTAKKEKRIATAVRIAVVAATAYKSDPEEVLGIALELTKAAAKAAPRFAETIASSVAYAPALSRLEGSRSRIRAVAFAAAKAPSRRRSTPIPPATSRESVAASSGTEEATPLVRTSTSQGNGPETAEEAAANVTAPAATPAESSGGDNTAPSRDQSQGESMAADTETPGPSATARITEDERSKLSVTAGLMVQHDDNIFISNSDKVGDTIYSFEPGLDFRVGQNSLDHAALSVQEDFVRYASHTAPNADLANATGSFGYDDGGLKLIASGAYQQLYQNNPDVLSLGPQALIRSNTLVINGSGELQLGAKTSASIGVLFNGVSYVNPGLVGGQDLSFPLDAYYHLTPKVDVFLGYTYGIFTPDQSGPKAKDGYAHVGARGDFTPKLSGTVTAGYMTRTISGVPAANHDLGFTGSLAYEVTPKTSASLSFSRDYSASALGQNQKNNTFSLGVETALSPQWQIGESINYQILGYGSQVFQAQGAPVSQERTDDFWTGNVHLTYIYSKWLSGSVGYTTRDDRSTISQIDFTDNVFNLTLNLSY